MVIVTLQHMHDMAYVATGTHTVITPAWSRISTPLNTLASIGKVLRVMIFLWRTSVSQ